MSLIITGIIDGPLPGGLPKALEIFVTEDIADLSAYGVGSANNGGASNGADFTFPADAVTAGSYIYLSLEADGFTEFFGFAPDYVDSSPININGDDAIELFMGEEVIDTFGVVGTDGTGEPWEHLDGWAYRNPGTEASATFDPADWTFSGVNALDFESSNDTAETPFPTGSFEAVEDTTPDLSVTLDTDVISENGGTATATVTRDGDTTEELVVMLSSDDTTEATVPTTVTIAAGETSATFAVTAVDDAISDGTQEVTLTASADGYDAGTVTLDVTNDDFSLTKIHDIQGTAGTEAFAVAGQDDRSAMVGQIVTIEAIVTADFQDGGLGTLGDFNGFFVQEEEVDYDLDALTSEGIFIYDGSNPAVDVQHGDKVRVTGTVTEFFGLTQLTDVSVEFVSGDNTLPAATEIEFPVASVQIAGDTYIPNLEAYEGMLVTIPQDMVITEMYNLDRYGEYRIASERFEQFTQTDSPDVDGYDQHLQDVARSTITLDDGLSASNPNPLNVIDGNDGILTNADDFRMGDQITDATGVLHYTFDQYRIENGTGTFEHLNPAPETPDEVGGNFKVVSMNVLNYFTTLDNGTLMDNGEEPRGANNAEELDRQANKIVQAMLEMDANIYGLVEIENDFEGDVFALKDLVERLNDAVGAELYAFVDPGQAVVGGDAIANALIYRQDKVGLVGEMAILEEFEGTSFLSPLTNGRPLNRAAIAQTFEDLNSGETLTVSVNHLKSKGSATDDVGDPDALDGSGNGNLTRAAAAEILAEWLDSDPTGTGATNSLILGDLNSYKMELPIEILEAAGYTDLAGLVDPDAYSYVFDGQIGTLDYAMANEALKALFAGATEWNLNADEADLFDYDFSYKDPSYYDGDTPARYSDHDPVIVSFDFYNDDIEIKRPDFYVGTALNDKMEAGDTGTRLLGEDGNDLLIGGEGDDTVYGGEGNDILRDGDGTDLVKGDQGDDTLIWEGGELDRFFGGTGADVFTFNSSILSDGKMDNMKVYDFEIGIDSIDLSGAVIQNIIERDWKVELVFAGDGDTMTFNDVTSFDDLNATGSYLV